MAYRTKKAADSHRLSPAKQDLAAEYLPLALALARPLKHAWAVAHDEFESAALMALVEAARVYDNTRKVRFATFARHRVRGALRDVQRSLALKGFRQDPNAPDAPRLLSLQLSVGSNAEPRVRFVLAEEREDNPETVVDETDALEAWLRKLPRRHAAACREIYLNDCTQAEAAHRLGCSQSRLSYMHHEALVMLRRGLGLPDDLDDETDEALDPAKTPIQVA